MRHHLPEDIRPEPDDDRLLPYAAFLAEYASASLRLEFWTTLREGRREWVALPGLVALSPRVRTLLRAHLRYPANQLAQREGPLVLFRAVAYCEFWAHEGWTWWARYLWRRQRWDTWATGRAHQLLTEWLAWRARTIERRP